MVEVVGSIEEIRRSAGEIRFQWTIGDFLSLSSNSIYESPTISWHGASFRMAVWHWKQLWLDLFSVDEGPTFPLKVSVGLRGPAGVEHQREIESEIRGFNGWQVWSGESSSPQLADVRRNLQPDGSLVIWCHMKAPARDPCPQVTSEAINEGAASSERRDASIQLDGGLGQAEALADESDTSERQAADEVLGSLRSLYQSGEGCDVVLKVRGKEFQAHKVILQMRSPVFKSMFTHEMLEKQLNSVTIEDCDPESFPAFLEHLYTGGVRMISGGNVFALYSAAGKYGLDALKGACGEFLKRNLGVASFCRTVALSVKHGERVLTELATRFFCDHTLDIVKTPEWQTFLAENPTVGNELFIKQMEK